MYMERNPNERNVEEKASYEMKKKNENPGKGFCQWRTSRDRKRERIRFKNRIREKKREERM